jgi:hypothetical protein
MRYSYVPVYHWDLSVIILYRLLSLDVWNLDLGMPNCQLCSQIHFSIISSFVGCQVNFGTVNL